MAGDGGHFWSGLNGLDWGLLTLLLLSVLLGLWRGLVAEVLSVASWVAGFVLGQTYAADVAQHLPPFGAPEPLQAVTAFALVFVATVVAGALLAWLIKKMVAAVGLRPIDRLLGGAFGLLRGGVILLALAVIVGMTPLQAQQAWRSSVVGRSASERLMQIKPLLPAYIARFLS
jgi:membrane protein required for colicin V production